MVRNRVQLYQAKVRRVIDGDTVVIDRDGELIMCRLMGIDAPEDGQRWCVEARDFLIRCVGGKEVQVMQYGTDKYGRALIILTNHKGWDVNAEMIAMGLAWYLESGGKCLHYMSLEILARKRKFGIWSENYLERPWEYRRRKRREKLIRTSR